MSDDLQPPARVGRRVARTVYWQDEPLFVAASTTQADQLVEVLNAGALALRPANVPPEPVRATVDRAQLLLAVETIEHVRNDMELLGLLASAPASQRLDMMRRALTAARRILVDHL